jgi:RNA polymerase sigma factor (TIGR02999 family)
VARLRRARYLSRVDARSDCSATPALARPPVPRMSSFQRLAAPDDRDAIPPYGPPVQPAQLFHLVYERLKTMASRELRKSGGHTLDTTVLVHELYFRIGAVRDLAFDDRGQFFAYCARAMRHIVIDRMRRRVRLKAGGGELQNPQQALQLDAALTALELSDARASRVVELHHFAGLSLQEVADILGVARRTVDRDWRYARAFLAARVDA